jgi:toxin ParE1/3/4
MAFLVEFSTRARLDLEVLYIEKNAAESDAAARWYNELEKAVDGLGRYPHRCAPAPEARNFKRKLWQLLYGKKPHVYRVIYEIDEAWQAVRVIAIRHGARRQLKPSDLK